MIYADYNGSSQLLGEVKKYLLQRLETGPFANPNAIHSMGQKINLSLSKCRKITADALGAKSFQIIFNSGASEGISHVFYSCLHRNPKKTILISSIEHSAVVNVAKHYQEDGRNLIIIPVDENGVIRLDVLKNELEKNKNDLALVSIMAANNETGVIQPYLEIGELCEKYQVPFFSDTTQFIGKTDFNFEHSKMDYAVLSSHKVGSIIGCGAILVKNPTQFKPMIFGGGQEFNLRGGTQNYIGIECLAIALNYFHENKQHLEACRQKRISFEKKIKELHPNVVIVGENAPRLASTTLIGLPGLHGQAVQIELESQNIFVTTSSACSDNEPTTSKVLKAMNVKDDLGRSVVRISLCLGSSDVTYNEVLQALNNAYSKLIKLKSF